MKIVENFSPKIRPEMFGWVREMWPTHNTEQIANLLNTKFGMAGTVALDGRAIENMKRRLDQLDRIEPLGRKL